MDNPIGSAKTACEWNAKRYRQQSSARHPIEDADGARRKCILLDMLPGAEPLQRFGGIGSNLQAGADLAQTGALLKNEGTCADSRQAERRREPGNAAAGNDDWKAGVLHSCLLRAP